MPGEEEWGEDVSRYWVSSHCELTLMLKKHPVFQNLDKKFVRGRCGNTVGYVAKPTESNCEQGAWPCYVFVREIVAPAWQCFENLNESTWVKHAVFTHYPKGVVPLVYLLSSLRVKTKNWALWYNHFGKNCFSIFKSCPHPATQKFYSKSNTSTKGLYKNVHSSFIQNNQTGITSISSCTAK